eukprot:787879-Prymnesium_polylepis.1
MASRTPPMAHHMKRGSTATIRSEPSTDSQPASKRGSLSAHSEPATPPVSPGGRYLVPSSGTPGASSRLRSTTVSSAATPGKRRRIKIHERLRALRRGSVFEYVEARHVMPTLEAARETAREAPSAATRSTLEEDSASRGLPSIPSPVPSPRVMEQAMSRFTAKSDATALAKRPEGAWQILYCGGAQPVIEQLEAISERHGIMFRKEKFDW